VRHAVTLVVHARKVELGGGIASLLADLRNHFTASS
jgi:hypothetical protein